MVTLGVSISQTLIIILAVISLLVLVSLLWMNHRTPEAVRPMVVLQRSRVLCPVQSVSGQSMAHLLRLPARAPPTFPVPSSFAFLDANDPDPYLMVRPVFDSADEFR